MVDEPRSACDESPSRPLKLGLQLKGLRPAGDGPVLPAGPHTPCRAVAGGAPLNVDLGSANQFSRSSKELTLAELTRSRGANAHGFGHVNVLTQQQNSAS